MTNKHSRPVDGLSFVQRVRRREIAQPTQKTFSVTRWRERFETVQSPSIQDRRLYKAGLWAFQKFEAIRQKLDRAFLQGISRVETIRMCIAEANRNLQILDAKSKSVDDLIVAEQIVQAKIDRPPAFGGSADPEALLISSVDALRFSIQKAFQEEESEEGLVERNDLEILEPNQS